MTNLNDGMTLIQALALFGGDYKELFSKITVFGALAYIAMIATSIITDKHRNKFQVFRLALVIGIVHTLVFASAFYLWDMLQSVFLRRYALFYLICLFFAFIIHTLGCWFIGVAIAKLKSTQNKP